MCRYSKGLFKKKQKGERSGVRAASANKDDKETPQILGPSPLAEIPFYSPNLLAFS